MDHAFLITAYSCPEHLRELITVISSAQSYIYIHLDKKSESKFDYLIQEYRGDSRVQFLEENLRVSWGGYSHLQAINLLINKALENNSLQRFHLISGSDYLVRPIRDLFGHFEQHKDVEYLEYAPLPISTWRDSGGVDRIRRYYLHDMLPPKTLSHTILEKIFLVLQKVLFVKRQIPNGLLPLYGGSTWWSLTREAVEHYKTEFRKCGAIFKHTFCGEEIAMQSILMNSSFSGKVCNDNLRYIDWTPTSNPPPRILDVFSFEKIVASNNFFARKFSYPTSETLVKKLQEEVINAR